MKVPYFALRNHVADSGLRGGNDLFNVLFVAFAYGEAALLVVGGADRWRGEQFTVARTFPYSPYSWAIVLAIAATVFAVGISMGGRAHGVDATWGVRGWCISIGAFLCAVWSFTYSYTLWLSGQIYPDQVSFSGVWSWSFWGFLYMVKVGQHLEFRVWSSR